MLGSFWDNLGIMLGYVWDNFGIILELFWDDFGAISGSLFWAFLIGEPSSDHRGNQARVAGNRRPRETQYDSLSEL